MCYSTAICEVIKKAPEHAREQAADVGAVVDVRSHEAQRDRVERPHDEDDADPPVAREGVTDHGAIARLENMQRQLQAGIKQRPGQGKDRDAGGGHC